MSIFLVDISPCLNDLFFPVDSSFKNKTQRPGSVIGPPRQEISAAGWRGHSHAICLPMLLNHRLEIKILKRSLKDLVF